MTPTQQVQEELEAYLRLPESFPLVISNSVWMEDILNRKAHVQNERRFSQEPQPITEFGAL